MNRLLRKITDFFIPNRCAVCDGFISSDRLFCPHCADASVQAGIERFSDGSLDAVCYCFIYHGPIVKSIWKYKFRGCTDKTEGFADKLCEVCERHIGSGRIDGVVCVPMDKDKQKRRGYNQSELLARAVSERMRIEYLGGFLKRIRKNEDQHALSSSARRENIKGVFGVTTGGVFSGKGIVIVDDVLTTGETAKELARQLKKAGAVRVYALVIAKAGKKGAGR